MTPNVYAVRWGKPDRPWWAAMVAVNDHPRWGRVLPFYLTREGWQNVAHGHETINGKRFRSEGAAIKAASEAGIPLALAKGAC
jgi:hypothetical protein